MRDHSLGLYPDDALAKSEVRERYCGAWWRHVIKPGLAGVNDLKPPVRGASDIDTSGEA
jgi:hypothetical protein